MKLSSFMACQHSTFSIAQTREGLAPLLAVLILLPAICWPGTVRAQSGTCVFYSDITSALYLLFPNSNYINGNFGVYLDSTCSTVVATLETGPLGYVRTRTQAAAAQLCSDKHETDLLAFRDFTKYNSQENWYCLDPNAPQNRDRYAEYLARGRNSGARRGELSDRLFTCEKLVQETDLEIVAVNGLRSGIECQRVDNAGVGIQWVIDLGLLDAVDVWSYVGGGYEVCFPQSGRIIFLDAATSPRTVRTYISYGFRDGYTCAFMGVAGTLVLVTPNSAEISSDSTSSAATGATVDSAGDVISWATILADCRVTTDFNLRLRRQPGGDSLRLVPRNTTLTATMRTVYWFKVKFNTVDGWIAASLTTTEGDCAPDGDSEDAL